MVAGAALAALGDGYALARVRTTREAIDLALGHRVSQVQVQAPAGSMVHAGT